MHIKTTCCYLGKKFRIIVVQSFVLSHINYCITIWGTITSSLVGKVQNVQNFAGRVAAGGIKKIDHVSQPKKS